MNSALEQVRALAAQARRQEVAAQTLADGMAGLRATVRDTSSAITVTVDATGALLGLQLGEGVRGHSPDRLAEAIMATVRQAQQDVLGRAASMVESTVGTGSATGAAVLQSLERRYAALCAERL